MLVCSKEESGVSYQLLRVAWLLFDYDKKTHFYGTDKRLFEAEIHLIVAIKENPGFHVAALAQKFGVTKGAVSQLVQKLQKKGMVTKQSDPDNQSKVLLRLTTKGQTAYSTHASFHREFDEKVNKLLEEESEDHVLFLKRFLSTMAQDIESREE
ncbi:MarR family winged helix-turn-helix transcriptional regulator [Salidesulfovibrio onnuriiensis]|uniref:MarR family winged helix-turn-helix transcriptional regulator n=1 Tax=Salidesulfovibrio onnuriiensis TaxID=2583823 RepID=UPI0011C8808C|nr:MarR family transcriptional regulator [Salidesulfovibrio onnuriiensis]